MSKTGQIIIIKLPNITFFATFWSIKFGFLGKEIIFPASDQVTLISKFGKGHLKKVIVFRKIDEKPDILRSFWLLMHTLQKHQ
jgi:hypothetical protein